MVDADGEQLPKAMFPDALVLLTNLSKLHSIHLLRIPVTSPELQNVTDMADISV